MANVFVVLLIVIGLPIVVAPVCFCIALYMKAISEERQVTDLIEEESNTDITSAM